MVLTEKNVNLLTAFILLMLNCIMFFFDKSGTVDRFINIAIPAIGFVFIFIFRNKNLFLFYSIVGSLITIFGTYGNFSGSVMFFISIYDNKSNKNIYFNTILIILSLCIKIYRMDYFNAHFFSLVIAFFFIFFHMYIRFWKTTEIRSKKSLSRGLTIEQIETVKTLMMGYHHDVAAKKLNIERASYSARVKSLRDRYKVSSDFQLALALREDQVIGEDDFTMVRMKLKENTD